MLRFACNFLRVPIREVAICAKTFAQRTLWTFNKPPARIAKIENLSLSYYSYYPKYLILNQKDPVILLHGLYTSKEYFYEITSSLAKKLQRPIYVLDMRNHGESPHGNFDAKATLTVLSQDVANFMDELSIGRALLIGHGIGGRVMVQFAQLNEPRVEKLITIDVSQDGPYVFSKTFPMYLSYLSEINLNNSNASLSYVRLAMKEILKAHIKNPVTLKFVLDNIRLDRDGNYKWRFNSQVLEQILQHWSQVKEISYGYKCQCKLLNLITKNNFITSEDYLDLKKSFNHCQVEHVNFKFMNNCNKPRFIKTVENFALM